MDITTRTTHSKPVRATDESTETGRPTVIPCPRSRAMFPGWGVRF